jgi:hypothetical protein
MGRTAWTEHQCPYKGDLYLYKDRDRMFLRKVVTNLQGRTTQITTGTCSTVVPHNLHNPRGRIFLQKLKLPPSIHLRRYSPFRALSSLTRRHHSSLFVALLLHPLIPSSCIASLWTTSAHLVLGLPTGLVVWKFPFRTFFWNPFFFHPCDWGFS